MIYSENNTNIFLEVIILRELQILPKHACYNTSLWKEVLWIPNLYAFIIFKEGNFLSSNRILPEKKITKQNVRN